MPALGSGDLESSRVRSLYPLPLMSVAWRSAPRSARSRHRVSEFVSFITVTNRCIVTLNRLYDPSSVTFPLPLPPSQHVSSMPPGIHPHRVHIDAHTDSRSPHFTGTTAQRRLLSSIYSHCRDFVSNARASLHRVSPLAGRLCDINDVNHHALLTSWQFMPVRPTDIVTLEGPLTSTPATSIAHASASSPLPLLSAFSSSPTSITPLIASRVALPDELNIVPFVDVLPPDIAATYHSSSASALLRSRFDVDALNADAPLRSPRVAGSRHEYIKLVARLHAQRMISFTSSPKSVNGVFTVGKDDDHDRLIIDAQPANRLFIDPPHIGLPDPSHLVQIQVPTDTIMFVGKSDLSNYYHHLGMPEWMQPYFALPPLTRHELLSIGISTSLGGVVHPMCVTLPMGFSHAVYIAEKSHEHVLYSSGVLSPDDNLLRMTSPSVRSDRALHGIVIDDFFTFCLDIDVATRQFERVIDAYRHAGFVVKSSKVVLPTSAPIKVIGFDICGRDSTICLSIAARIDLVTATLAVLREGIVTGIGLAHIIGRWTWCMLLRRSSLAILQHSYRFITVAHRRRFSIWPTVRRELWMLIGILPLLQSSFASPIFHRVIASDASELGGGVVTTPLTDALHRRLWPLCSTRYHATVQAQLNSAAGCDALDDFESHGHSATFLLAHTASDSYRAYYADVVTTRWSTIISKAWRISEHINALELRAVVLAVHWVLTFPSCLNRRVYLLVDSTVAFFTMWKGRSSSPLLLVILRKLSALLLGSDMSLLPGWIPSKVNPADGPSRLTSIGTIGNASA